jgi:hypothetical protein
VVFGPGAELHFRKIRLRRTAHELVVLTGDLLRTGADSRRYKYNKTSLHSEPSTEIDPCHGAFGFPQRYPKENE